MRIHERRSSGNVVQSGGQLRLATVYLADRIRGEGPFAQQFRGGERISTLAEVREIQRLLNAQGFIAGGTDGRIGPETVIAFRAYQQKVGLKPADGYAGAGTVASGNMTQGAVARTLI